jgi:hypothetical protein
MARWSAAGLNYRREGLTDFLTGEWIFSGGTRPNGGGVVFVRSLWVTTLIMLSAYMVWWVVNPTRLIADLSLYQVRLDSVQLAKWGAGVFGGVYLAFYTRFAAQWSYLANLYNQIKQSEVEGGCNTVALAEWKAGYIEDALDLHLASKHNVAAIIRAWGFHGAQSADVRRAFIDFAHRGLERWDDVSSLTARDGKRT